MNFVSLQQGMNIMACHLMVGKKQVSRYYNSYGASPEKRIGVIDIDIDMFVNCNQVDTWWQQYSTHLHTDSTVHIYTQTTHITTQLLEGFLGFEPRAVKQKLMMY